MHQRMVATGNSRIVNGKKGGWTGPDFPRMYIALTDSAFHVLSGGKLEINAQDFTIGPNLVSAFDEPLLHNIYGDSATFKFVDRFNTVISEVNFYIPDQLNVGFFENFPDLSHSGGQILPWNRDLLNPYGVLITSLYDPAGNPTLATSYPEKINGYEHVGSDQGSFTYSSSDVSAFPVNSRLILHCIRGNYAVDSTSFGKVLYLCYSKTGGFVDLQ